MARNRAVGIVAPSAAVPDTAVIDRAAQRFAARGWQAQAGDSCFTRHERFAGSDQLRLAELQSFATDPRLDLVLAARGGFGLTRLLDRLDYAAIARRAPLACGYSDFTAFNLAYLARAGGVSLQGPSATELGAAQPDAFTVEQFFAVLDSPRHSLRFAADGPALTVAGKLWGGNLAMLCALVGTPYFPRVRGGILFVEDVNEPAYRIERMLLQLAQAGVLARQRAILLGDFVSIPAMATDYEYTLDSALAHLRTRLAVPIVRGLPFGHAPRKATLPVGARATLRVAGTEAELVFAGFGRAGG
ncbi:MAG: LD-carboxypeptidase [Betaproteobacteria bacterium]